MGRINVALHDMVYFPDSDFTTNGVQYHQDERGRLTDPTAGSARERRTSLPYVVNDRDTITIHVDDHGMQTMSYFYLTFSQ